MSAFFLRRRSENRRVLTRETDTSDRQWADYSAEKNAWIAAHPEATHTEIERASRAIAERMGL